MNEEKKNLTLLKALKKTSRDETKQKLKKIILEEKSIVKKSLFVKSITLILRKLVSAGPTQQKIKLFSPKLILSNLIETYS